VRLTLNDGLLIKNQLLGGVNVTLRVDPTFRAGADPEGHILLYTPTPFALGSSVSHWDISPTPNLLMEPALNSDVSSNTDLTVYHFMDIGWETQGTVAVGHQDAATPNRLMGNFPNPFNPFTAIRFALEREESVEIGIYDLSGRLISRVLEGRLPPGSHTATWDGRTLSGRRASAGVYLYRMTASGRSESRQMVLLH
jgi:hypothetical protein